MEAFHKKMGCGVRKGVFDSCGSNEGFVTSTCTVMEFGYHLEDNVEGSMDLPL